MFRRKLEPGLPASPRTRITSIVSSLSSLLAVQQDRCVICSKGAVYPEQKLPLCAECLSEIPWIMNIQCPICGRPEQCGDCRRRPDRAFACNRSAVSYTPAMKAWLAQFKFRGNEKLQQLFSCMLSAAYVRLIGELKPEAPQLISFIPLSEERSQERGFNQAEQMARGLGRATGLPVLPLLQRNIHTVKQSFKNRASRLTDLEQVFAVNRVGAERTQHLFTPGSKPLKVIVIDDVYTTGSTMQQASRQIKHHFGSKTQIYGLTWAR